MSTVTIVGGINMDVVAISARLPLPGETISGKDLRYFPGGKGANQAVAAARAGASVTLIGRVGDDAFSGQLLEFLGQQGVNLDGVTTTPGTPTGTALIVVDHAGENMIVVVPGANGEVTPGDVTREQIRKGDVLVSQFEIPQATVIDFFEAGRSAGASTLLNPAPAMSCSPELLQLTDVLVLNERELAYFAEKSIEPTTSTDEIVRIAKDLRVKSEQVIVVTLGARGVVAIVNERRVEVPGHPVSAIDTTGAGDCFVGNLAAALADGKTLERAVRLANAAASLCVQRMGAGVSMPFIDETSQVAALAAGRRLSR
jgi:ribokinase